MIEDWTCGSEKGGHITPWRRGRKFYDIDWKNAQKETASLYLLCRQSYVDVVGGGLLYTFRKFYFASPLTMLNYLWVINPRHKDAVRSIQLEMKISTNTQCLDDAPPLRCGRPFEMIASCKNLQHFALNLQMWRSQYVIYRSNGVSGRRESVSVSEEFLQLVLNCTSLRSIRGLKSFHMAFATNWFSWSSRRSETEHPHGAPFTDQIRLIEVVDKIRSLVTQDPE